MEINPSGSNGSSTSDLVHRFFMAASILEKQKRG